MSRKKILFFIVNFLPCYIVAIVVQISARNNDYYFSDYIIATFWIAVTFFVPLILLSSSLVYFSKKHIKKALWLFIPAITIIAIYITVVILDSRPEGFPGLLSFGIIGQSDHIRTNKFTGRCEYGGAHSDAQRDPWYYQWGCQDEQALQDYFNRHGDDPVQMKEFLQYLNKHWPDHYITQEVWKKSCTWETTADRIYSCYRSVAIINDNPSLCTFVASALYADCLASYTSCQGKSEIEDKNLDQRIDLNGCLSDFDKFHKTEYTTNSDPQKTIINQNNNYIDDAVSNKDVTVCQQVTSIGRPYCIQQVAIATKDDALCDTIEGDQKYSSNCLHVLARLKNDSAICDRIQLDNFLTTCKNSFTNSDN